MGHPPNEAWRPSGLPQRPTPGQAQNKFHPPPPTPLPSHGRTHTTPYQGRVCLWFAIQVEGGPSRAKLHRALSWAMQHPLGRPDIHLWDRGGPRRKTVLNRGVPPALLPNPQPQAETTRQGSASQTPKRQHKARRPAGSAVKEEGARATMLLYWARQAAGPETIIERSPAMATTFLANLHCSPLPFRFFRSPFRQTSKAGCPN